MPQRIGLLLLCLLALPLSAATFAVTSANDSGPGTLRQAILDANALGAGPHTIAFDMPDDPRTIAPVSPLPALTASQTLLDATTQPGYTGVPVVTLYGGGAGAGAHGLSIAGAGSRVQGFAINSFSEGAGVYVTAPDVEVMNNYIGLGADGVLVAPNLRGVLCADGCRAIRIGSPAGNDRNVISGNLGEGISIRSAGSGNSIRANYIGTDATGTLERGNFMGIEWIESSGRIGDLVFEGGNVISGNSAHGVLLVGANPGTSLNYNLIGIAANLMPLGNGLEGVSMASVGVFAGENLIAYNRGHGVMVVGAGHERNTIRHNRIFSNNLRGIALGTLGGTMPNDPRDADAGYANNLQNHPVLTSAVWHGGTLTLQGALHSTPGRAFLIDVHWNTSCGGGVFGEAEHWVGVFEAIANANGDATIDANLPYAGTGFITATATDRVTGDTSELSQCVVVRNALASTVQFEVTSASVNEGDGVATLIVSRSGSSSGRATVEVVTSHGSASGPGDYLSPSDSLLVWDDGDAAPKTVSIPIVANDIYELPEEFFVELRNATGATLGTATIATITIQDVVTPAMPADLSAYVETRATGARQGDEISYEISATNLGPNDATGVTLTNALPPQLLFVDMRAPAGWTCTTPAAGTNGTITCTAAVLPMANGNTAYFSLTTRVAFDAVGSIVNTVSVSHSGSDPDPANSTASSSATAVQGTIADVSVTKTVDTIRAAAGSAFTYTITVANSGPDIAAAVTLTDVLPPQLRFVSRFITSTGGMDFFCTTPEVGTNGTVTCDGFRMAPGASATLMLHVSVAPEVTSGTVTNTATITSPTADPDDADHVATAPGVELAPGADLSLRKLTATTSARPNAIFTYTLSLQNSGPNAAANVVVTDVLPADLLFEFAGPAGGFTCTTPPIGTNGTVRCTAETLPASRVAALTLRVRVAPDARTGTVTNRATVTSATLDPDLGDTTAEAEPVTIAAPAGAERRLDPNAAGPAQTSPQVATTRQNALAVWREGAAPLPAGGTASIRGALFRPDAEGQTMIDFAAPEAGTNVTHPNVAAALDRYLVVWRETKSAQTRLLARRMRVDGSFIDATPLLLETGPAVVCCTEVGDPRPAVASNGRDFYVAWVAGLEVRGMAIPAEGPVAGSPSVISREADTVSRERYDLEVVWTSALYAVVWLDRVFPFEQPLVLRYARVTSAGVVLDAVSNTIAGPAFRSITATPHPDGVMIAADYDEPGTTSGSRQWCLGVLLLTASGEPAEAYSLRCDNAPPVAAPALHSTFVPVSRGFLLVQPGRRYLPPFNDTVIRTSTVNTALTELSDPTTLGAVARELSAANWMGAALLVYNRTDGDVPRVFAFLIQGHGRTRAVRH